MYTALYRTERPETFEQVLGQEHIIKILKHQIKTGTVSHAYLFCGTRGTGKTTMARLLAKGINCLSEDEDGRPCGQCKNCRAISDGTFMDVVEIDAASNNGVDNIRELRESVKYRPTAGPKKIYVIDEVHMLSTGASNALLKTLEEPPEYVVFILATTEPHKLPATILSRCMRLDFKRVPQKILMNDMARICHNRGVKVSESALRIMANCADGSVRDGLSVLDQVLASGPKEIRRENVLECIGSEEEDFFIELTDCVSLKKTAEALVLLGKALSDGKDVKTLMRDWMGHYRNLLMTKFIKNPEDALNLSTENVDRIKEQSNHITSEEINTAIIKLSKAISETRFSTQPRILLELAIVDISTGFFEEPQPMQRRVAIGDENYLRKYTLQDGNLNNAGDQSSDSRATADRTSAGDENCEEMSESNNRQALDGESKAVNGEDASGDVGIRDDSFNEPQGTQTINLDGLWKDVLNEGCKQEVSISVYKDTTHLKNIEGDQFTVVAVSPVAFNLLKSKGGTIEKIIGQFLGKDMRMNCVFGKGEKIAKSVATAGNQDGPNTAADVTTQRGPADGAMDEAELAEKLHTALGDDMNFVIK